MPLRFYELAEAGHHIINPFTHEKLMLLGEKCHLKPSMHQLDLCCGKAEMLCQWSQRWGIRGVGVDISAVFIAEARERVAYFELESRLTLIEGDATTYKAEPHSFDIVSCIGATWIGGGLVGTLHLMAPALKTGGLMLVGEPYWIHPPTPAMLEALETGADDFTSLVGTLDRIESAGFELVEMVLADGDSWDRYQAEQWMTLDTWLRANPDDPDAAAIRAWNAHNKRAYLEYGRDNLGWGVFVLRAR